MHNHSRRLSTHLRHLTAEPWLRAERGCLLQGLGSAESYPSSAGRQLLQYGYNNGYYGNRGYYWSGGRIAGVIVGCVCFGLAILFAILACTIRRRRMARVSGAVMLLFDMFPMCICHAALLCSQVEHLPFSLQANNAYPIGTYPVAPVQDQAYPQPNQYPQAGTYPNQAGTYPNQAYPQGTEGYNPAAYNPNAAYPNTASGTPANGYNGVQMSALPHEKAGYQSHV